MAILTYHAIGGPASVLATPHQVFAEQLRALRGTGARFIRLTDVPRVMTRTDALESAVALTFDDGFRSVYEDAYPVLRECGFPATVFLVTDYCGRTNSWPGQPARVERRPLLTWAEAREMNRAGIAFGSHTRTHPDLTIVPTAVAEEELASSKKAIEDAIGCPVEALAYPYGAYDDRVRRCAQRHYSVACGTELGFVGPSSDPFALERLDVYYLRSPGWLGRFFTPEARAYLRLRHGLRVLRRRASGARRRGPGPRGAGG